MIHTYSKILLEVKHIKHIFFWNVIWYTYSELYFNHTDWLQRDLTKKKYLFFFDINNHHINTYKEVSLKLNIFLVFSVHIGINDFLSTQYFNCHHFFCGGEKQGSLTQGNRDLNQNFLQPSIKWRLTLQWTFIGLSSLLF